MALIIVPGPFQTAYGKVDKLLELQRTNDYQVKRFYLGRVGLDLS